jgi:hypothetical protein
MEKENIVIRGEIMKRQIKPFIVLFGLLLSCNNKTKNELTITNETENIAIIDEVVDKDLENQNIQDEFTISNVDEIVDENLEAKDDNFIFPKSIEYNIKNTDIPSRHDSNMKSNINIIYKPESDVILNIEDVEHKSINDILNRPIINKNIYIPSEYADDNNFDSIFELLKEFGICLRREDIERINNEPLYNMIKIETDDLNLYVYRIYEQVYKLFVIEYDGNSLLYDYNIKIGTGKDEINNRLDIPSYYSEEDDIYIYSSFKTLRQVNILFDNDKVKKVQLISFGGI